MTEKGGISASFYLQIGILGSIVVSSIVGFNYLGTIIENKIDDRIAPLVEKINDLEKRIEEHDQLLASNTDRVTAASVSMNLYIDYYNRVYHKEFLRPSDIVERNIEIKKRRR